MGSSELTGATAAGLAGSIAAREVSAREVVEAHLRRIEEVNDAGLTIEVWRSYGGDVGAGELWRLLRRWDAFRSEMLAFAERYDLILCPVFPSAARRHGTMSVPGEIDPTSFTTPHSLTGWPAATVRCGTSAEGLPIDVQLVARPWRDDVALAAALRLERTFTGWPPPTLPEGRTPSPRPVP